MELLSLDDARWYELCHRNWGDGKPLAPETPFVPDILRSLCSKPSEIEVWNDLYPWLCSEGTAWSASYAVVPYVLEFARAVDVSIRYDYLYFIGLVAQCECEEMGPSFKIKPYLKRSYEESLPIALSMIADLLLMEHNQTETRHMIATIAALKGHRRLAVLLENIDCVIAECSCGNSVYPQELLDAT